MNTIKTIKGAVSAIRKGAAATQSGFEQIQTGLAFIIMHAIVTESEDGDGIAVLNQIGPALADLQSVTVRKWVLRYICLCTTCGFDADTGSFTGTPDYGSGVEIKSGKIIGADGKATAWWLLADAEKKATRTTSPTKVEAQKVIMSAGNKLVKAKLETDGQLLQLIAEMTTAQRAQLLDQLTAPSNVVEMPAPKAVPAAKSA